MVPSISHPTDRPNFSVVELGEITIYFSYETPIAYYSRQHGRAIRKNDWGPTTGKHLNYVDSGSVSERIDGRKFEFQLGLLLNGGPVIEEEPV
jgi:hypothetical protein